MKRFVTYLYTYKDGQKMKNAGHIRVDIKGTVLEMQMNIKDFEFNHLKGVFYIIIKCEKVCGIPLEEILIQNSGYRGSVCFNCYNDKDVSIGLENVIGVGIRFENGGYMASCWMDGEEEVMASGDFLSHDIEVVENYEEVRTDLENIMIEQECDEVDEKIQVASMEDAEFFSDEDESKCECEIKETYRKINLNEICTLPSSSWHFTNNSFLIHGFWNYGYLVLKETMEENKKRIALGVPGIFEQPEMVMATYFGFPKFEALSSQTMEMEIGQCWSCSQNQKEQQPQAGTFGCWFVNL